MTERLVKEKIKNYKIHRSLTPSLLHRTVSPVRSTTISLITLNNTPLSFDRSSDHIRLINYHRTPACVGRMCRRKLLLRVRSTNAWRRTRGGERRRGCLMSRETFINFRDSSSAPVRGSVPK